MLSKFEVESTVEEYRSDIANLDDNEVLSSHYQTNLIMKQMDVYGKDEDNGMPKSAFIALHEIEVKEITKRNLFDKYKKKFNITS